MKIAYFNGLGVYLENINPYKDFFKKLFPELKTIKSFKKLYKFNILIIPDAKYDFMNDLSNNSIQNLKKFISNKKNQLITIGGGSLILAKSINLYYTTNNMLFSSNINSKNSIGIITSISENLLNNVIDGKPIVLTYPLIEWTPNHDISYNFILQDKKNIYVPYQQNKITYLKDVNNSNKIIILDDGTQAILINCFDLNLGNIWKIHNTWAGYPVVLERGNILMFFANLLISPEYFKKQILLFLSRKE
jgi:hypothetical protein